MRDIVTAYTFDKTAKTITLTGINPIVVEKVLGIWNATRGVKYYDPHTTGFGATFATNIITLVDAVTSSHDNADDLIIFYEGALSTELASQATLAAVLAKIIAAPATEAKQDTQITALGTLATQATAAAILAKLIAAPSTEAKQDAIIAILGAALTINLPTNAATENGGHLEFQSARLTAIETILDDIETAFNVLNGNDFSTEAKQDALNALVTASNVFLQAIQTDINTIKGLLPAALTASGNLKVAVQEAIPAGTNNIGDVDVLTLPAIPAGTNTIGTVNPPKASSANTPSIVTSAGDAISSNSSRKSWGVQNCGTNTLYVRMATGASTTVFHFALSPGGANDDGRGASVSDDTYTGVVSCAGTSPRFVVYEL